MAKVKGRRRRQYSEEEIAAARQRDAELTDTALADPAQMGDITAWLLTVQPSIRAKSLRNQVLLFKQAKERGTTVTDVRSFRDWIDSGRCPVKGTNYRITAPRGTEADESATTSSEDTPAPAGEDAPTKTRFRMIPAWDIANTVGVEDFEGEPPAVPQVELWDRLAEQVLDRGYAIDRTGAEHGVDHDTQVITVAAGVEPTVAAAALGVQLAAVITHQRTTKTGPGRPQPAEELPPGVEAAELALDDGFGIARVRVETNWENGRTRYTVTAPNVTGILTVHPERNTCEAIPTSVDVTYGDSFTALWCSHEDTHQDGSAPVVNGVELVGAISGVPFDRVTDVREWRWSVRPQRYVGRYTSEPAPDRTADRFRAVLRAVLLHWFARTDLAEVQLAAARCEAPTRLAERKREAAKLDEQLAALEAARATVAAQTDAIAALVDPNADPLPVEPASVQPERPLATVVEIPSCQTRKAEGFVRTPDELAECLAEDFADLAALPAGARVLEPSAGDGSIVRAILAAAPHVQVVAVEPNTARGEAIGADPRVQVIASTLEEYALRTTDRFDAVVMNPPFSVPGQPTIWIDHVNAAWRLLAPGGRLVAVAPNGYTFRQDKRHTALRALIEEHGGQHVDLGDDAFATSGAPGIRTVVISVDKEPAEPVAEVVELVDEPLMLFA
jgi:predicted RNA methylase